MADKDLMNEIEDLLDNHYNVEDEDLLLRYDEGGITLVLNKDGHDETISSLEELFEELLEDVPSVEEAEVIKNIFKMGKELAEKFNIDLVELFEVKDD